MATDDVSEKKRAGLCAICLHAHVVRSDRGAVFYQCRRADRDPDFPKYPRLPVLVCKGYEAPPASENAC